MTSENIFSGILINFSDLPLPFAEIPRRREVAWKRMAEGVGEGMNIFPREFRNASRQLVRG